MSWESWTLMNMLPQVTYFKKRRVMEHQRAKMLEKLQAEGAQKMPGEIGPPGPNAGLGGKS